MVEAVAALPSMDDFSQRLNTQYRVRPEQDGEFVAELLEMKVVVSNDVQENFTLLFRAPIAVPALQGTYAFKADGSDPFDLFLVPVSNDKENIYFEAVFNNLKNKGA